MTPHEQIRLENAVGLIEGAVGELGERLARSEAKTAEALGIHEEARDAWREQIREAARRRAAVKATLRGMLS